MKPKIGMVVQYNMPNCTSCNGHADHPAVITKVWSEDCVNLKVLFDCAPVEDQTSQTLSGGNWQFIE